MYLHYNWHSEIWITLESSSVAATHLEDGLSRSHPIGIECFSLNTIWYTAYPGVKRTVVMPNNHPKAWKNRICFKFNVFLSLPLSDWWWPVAYSLLAPSKACASQALWVVQFAELSDMHLFTMKATIHQACIGTDELFLGVTTSGTHPGCAWNKFWIFEISHTRPKINIDWRKNRPRIDKIKKKVSDHSQNISVNRWTINVKIESDFVKGIQLCIKYLPSSIESSKKEMFWI